MAPAKIITKTVSLLCRFAPKGRDAKTPALTGQMSGEKPYGPGPGKVGGVLPVSVARLVHEGVAGPGIGMEFIDFVVRGKRSRKLLRICGRWIGVFGAEMSHDRTVNLRSALRRRRGIAAGPKNPAAVVPDGGFEAWVCRCHQIGYAPAHAETEDADSRAILFLLSREEINRGIYIRDHAGIAQSGSAGRRRVPATEAVAIVHIGSGGGKTGARKIGRDM